MQNITYHLGKHIDVLRLWIHIALENEFSFYMISSDKFLFEYLMNLRI